MKDYEFTVAASGQSRVNTEGNFIKLKSATTELRILAEDSGGRAIADLRMTQGTSIKLPEKFIRVRIANDTVSTKSGVLICGTGDVNDSELTGTITASKGTVIDNKAHTVNAVSAVLLAADSSRRSVIINNEDATNAIFIGSDNTVTAANGLKVNAGQSLSLSNSAAASIFAIGAAAGITVKTLSELD